jgi:8-oxo-dGTP diphosphatase
MKLATLCYVRNQGKTLMIHRIKKQDDMHAGKWNGLGGKLEPGESPEECVIREVLEESGLRIRNPRLHGFLTFPGFANDEDWYAFVFSASEFEGQLIDSQEGNLAWINDEQLFELPLWEGDIIFLPWLNQDNFFSGKFVYQDGHLVNHNVFFHPPINQS